ncbi:hypothetical protein [Shewanella sp.]|uniref:hypothetical protein n=1 Tax=Shewanella sp. TaxID=50422 RepID=UPI003A96C546
MLKLLLITVFALAVLVMAYLGAPFIIFPHYFGAEHPLSSVWTTVWNNAYAPLIVSLPDDNLYKLQFEQMMADHCDNSTEN